MAGHDLTQYPPEKRGRGRPKKQYPLSKDIYKEAEKEQITKYGEKKPGENSEAVLRMLQFATLPKINTDDAEAIVRRTTEYFAICVEQNIKPNSAGLALSLGISRSTLFKWRDGKTKKPVEVVDALVQAMNLLTALHEDNMQEGRMNPVTGIFLAKANYGFKDNPEFNEGGPEPLFGRELTPEQLISEYSDVDT